MKHFASLLFCLACWWGAPQAAAQTYDQANMQLQFMNHYGQVGRKGGPAINAEGSPYFADDWQAVNLSTKDTTLRFEQVKLNLMTSNLEVLYRGEEKVVYSAHYRKVTLLNGATLIPANRYVYENKALNGFVELLGEGPVQVLVNHYIYIRPPNPQANIVGGPTVDKLMKSSDLYLFDGESLQPIKKKKDLQIFYRKQAKTLDRYLKENKMDIKDPQELLNLVEFIERGNS
jgi:hypothetical protein